MKQIRQFNPNVPCTPGYCLTYVQDGFGIPPKAPYALADWERNTYNHTDKNFPNVPTPVWFTGKDGVLKQFGHVAVRMPDGSVWSCSHPTNHTAMHFPSLEALNQYYSGQLIYLGWSEDVEEVKVMEQEGVDMITKTGLEVSYLYLLGRMPDKDAYKFVGKISFDDNYARIKKSGEYRARVAAIKKANINFPS